MKKQFGDKLEIKIYTLDAPEARPYLLEFRGSTNVRLNNEWVPLEVAIDRDKMETFLAAKLKPGEI